jgi:glyoxylase I family protein
LPVQGPALAAPHVWLDRLLIAWTADPDGNPIQIVPPR